MSPLQLSFCCIWHVVVDYFQWRARKILQFPKIKFPSEYKQLKKLIPGFRAIPNYPMDFVCLRYDSLLTLKSSVAKHSEVYVLRNCWKGLWNFGERFLVFNFPTLA